MDIILASSSPRRKDILQKAGYEFQIVPSNYDENILNLPYDKALVENCAYKKALEVLNRYPDSLIIGADTVVVLDNKILGKPKDEAEAFQMLSDLSNKTHFVQTSICVLTKDKKLIDSDITYVEFRKLTDSDILNYIKTSKPLDKAGSYGIQDEGFDFSINLKGNLDNVIGFSLSTFEKLLKEI